MAHQEVKIIEDSRTQDGVTRITTYQLRYWRAIHAELMTHRVFSRNASSSRAIPVKKILAQVWNDPAGPTYWGSNRPGMQAGDELSGWRLWAAKKLWKLASRTACVFAWGMMKVGLHKQYANRVLEPFQYISVVVTSTEWRNFFELRDHEMAFPEFHDLASEMKYVMKNSLPKMLRTGQWHLPYVLKEERQALALPLLVKLSTARCCRTSYDRHDGTPAPHEEDVALHDKLVVAEPLHASPAEHQVLYDGSGITFDSRIDLQGNLRGKGIVQYRKLLENPAANDYYMGGQYERAI